MRRMVINLHISEATKIELDRIIPKALDGERITYDDFIQAVFRFFKEINYEDNDIKKLIIDYKHEKWGVIQNANAN